MSIHVKYIYLQVLVSRLECLGSKAHVLQHFSVSLGILQSFSLKLYGGEGAIDLSQLLLKALLPLKSHQGSCKRQNNNERIQHP